METYCLLHHVGSNPPYRRPVTSNLGNKASGLTMTYCNCCSYSKCICIVFPQLDPVWPHWPTCSTELHNGNGYALLYAHDWRQVCHTATLYWHRWPAFNMISTAIALCHLLLVIWPSSEWRLSIVESVYRPRESKWMGGLLMLRDF